MPQSDLQFTIKTQSNLPDFSNRCFSFYNKLCWRFSRLYVGSAVLRLGCYLLWETRFNIMVQLPKMR